MCVTWKDFHDPESGIAGYLVTFGSCPSCSDLFKSQLNAREDELCGPSSLQLSQGVNVTACVTASHLGHAGLTVTACSEQSELAKFVKREEEEKNSKAWFPLKIAVAFAGGHRRTALFCRSTVERCR